EKDPQTYLPFRARPSARSDCILAPISVMIQLLRGNSYLGTLGAVVKHIEREWISAVGFALAFAAAASAQTDSPQLQRALEARIQAPQVTEFQLRQYLMKHVTPVNVPASAAKWSSEAQRVR